MDLTRQSAGELKPEIPGELRESREPGEPGEPRMHGSTARQELSANWFAAYTNSHHEKRVVTYLAERQIESFLPLYATRRRWSNGCDMNLQLPLFPNYVFVRIDRRERVHVLAVPGVVSLVGFGRNLAPLPDFEIEALRSNLGKRKIEPHPYLVIGARVRIKSGPMTGMEGVLVRRKNELRVVLALDIIMQCVAVEVDADDLEPVLQPAVQPGVRPADEHAGSVLLPSPFSGQPGLRVRSCEPR